MTTSGGLPALLNSVEDRLAVTSEGKVLHLVRHAAPYPREKRSDDTMLDPSLSPAGLEQAHVLGQALESFVQSDQMSRPSLLCSSRLARSRETAVVLGEYLKVPVSVYAGLDEIRIPADFSTGPYVTTDEKLMTNFKETGIWDDLGGFESSRALRVRATDVMTKIADHVNDGSSGIVVSHGALLNAFLSNIIDATPDYWCPLRHASVSEVGFRGGAWILLSLNWSVNGLRSWC